MSEQLGTLLPLVLLVLVFWFLILRPARKRQREARDIQRSLEVGARIMLTSGIFGTIQEIDEESLEVEIADDITIVVLRQAVARVLPADDDDGDAEEWDDEDDESEEHAEDSAEDDDSAGGKAIAETDGQEEQSSLKSRRNGDR